MSAIKMDLSKFKHVKSDAHTTTLQHPQGHTITLAHNALGPETRNQLSALAKDSFTPLQANEAKYQMAEGGKVKSTEKEKPKTPEKPKERPTGGREVVHDPETRKELNRERADNLMMADGGDVNDSGEDDEDLAKKVNSYKPDGGTLNYKKMREDEKAKRSAQPENKLNYKNYPSEQRVKQRQADTQATQRKNTLRNIDQLRKKKMADGGNVQRFKNGGPTGGGLQPDQEQLPTDQYGAPIQDEGRSDWNQNALRGLHPAAKKAAELLVEDAHAERHGATASWGDDDTAQAPTQTPPVAPAQAPTQTPPVAPAQAPTQTPPVDEAAVGATPEDMEPATDDIDEKDETASQPSLTAPSGGSLMGYGAANETEPKANTAQPSTSTEPTPPPLNTKDRMVAEDAAFQHDLDNGHITPETLSTLYHDKGLGGKIGMIFGLMASSMGSGLTKQPNALLEIMNNQIKNDIDAQVHSKENAQNLYRLNLQHELQGGQLQKMVQEGSLTQAQAADTMIQAQTRARALTNMQQNRAELTKLVAQVNQLPPGSPERAQKEQALALMNTAIQNENYQLADRAAAASIAGKMMFGTPEQSSAGGNADAAEQEFQQKTRMLRVMGNDKIADDMEKKHIPGIPGLTSRPEVPPAVITQIANHRQLDSLYSEAFDMANKYGGLKGGIQAITDPVERQKVLARASTLQNELLSTVRMAEDQGVYKKSDAEFLADTLGGNPVSMLSNLKTVPRLKEMQKINQDQYNRTVSSYGLKPPALSSSSKQQEAPLTKTIGGVTWQRTGPNRWEKVSQ